MTSLDEFRQRNVARIRSARLVQSVLSGHPDRNAYIDYLISVYNYAAHSPRVISLAASRCANSHPPLCRYLLRHAEEEIGHEQWASSDLMDLGLSDAQIASARPTPACMAMISLEYYVAEHWNPVALFGWLYALESLGDAIGSLVSQALEKGLRLESMGKGVRFLAGHGVADHAHSADLAEQIHQNVPSPQDMDDIFYIAKLSSDLYARIIEEVSESPRQWA